MKKIFQCLGIIFVVISLVGGQSNNSYLKENCDILLYYKGSNINQEKNYNLIVSKNKEKYIKFYNQFVSDKEVTEEIINQSIIQNVPINLSFALAKRESNFKRKAININYNSDKTISSIDRGIYQLNNKSFPNLSESDFFNYKTNIKYGISHLKYCLDSFKSSSEALSAYNGGHFKVQNNSMAYERETYKYVSDILNYSNYYEQGI